MATLHRSRCGDCGEFMRSRSELGDWAEEERSYAGDEFTEHQCITTGPARVGDTAPPPEQRARGGRPSTGRAKRAVRNYRYRCACEAGPPIRCGRRDLDATCGRCGCRFTWDPSGSEQLGPIRQPA